MPHRVLVREQGRILHFGCLGNLLLELWLSLLLLARGSSALYWVDIGRLALLGLHEGLQILHNLHLLVAGLRVRGAHPLATHVFVRGTEHLGHVDQGRLLCLVLVGLEILRKFKVVLPVLALDLVGEEDELLPKSLFRAACGGLDHLV